jgi:hypothetical protein
MCNFETSIMGALGKERHRSSFICWAAGVPRNQERCGRLAATHGNHMEDAA